jgi:hypothetical protein
MVFSLRRYISITILLFLLIMETAAFAAPKVRVGWYPVIGLNNYDKGTKEFSGYNYDYLESRSPIHRLGIRVRGGTFLPVPRGHESRQNRPHRWRQQEP